MLPIENNQYIVDDNDYEDQVQRHEKTEQNNSMQFNRNLKPHFIFSLIGNSSQLLRRHNNSNIGGQKILL